MIRLCKLPYNGFGVEDISEDGLTRTVWEFTLYADYSNRVFVRLQRYAPKETRKTTRHKWVQAWRYPEQGYSSIDNRDYCGGGLSRADVPIPQEVATLAIEWARSRVRMEELAI